MPETIPTGAETAKTSDLRGLARPIMVRLGERFIEQGDVAYILFWRMDGQLIDGNGGASCQYLEVAY